MGAELDLATEFPPVPTIAWEAAIHADLAGARQGFDPAVGQGAQQSGAERGSRGAAGQRHYDAFRHQLANQASGPGAQSQAAQQLSPELERVARQACEREPQSPGEHADGRLPGECHQGEQGAEQHHQEEEQRRALRLLSA